MENPTSLNLIIDNLAVEAVKIKDEHKRILMTAYHHDLFQPQQTMMSKATSLFKQAQSDEQKKLLQLIAKAPSSDCYSGHLPSQKK